MRADRARKPRPRTPGRVGALLVLGAVLSAGSAGAESVSLTWTAPGDDGSVGQAASYELRYSETPVQGDTASWWSSAASVGTLPAPLPAGTRESCIITGLAPGKTFYFVLRAADEVPNVSGFSNIARKQTPPAGAALQTPSDFTASAEPGGVLLGWSAIQTGGAELGYRVYRRPAGTASPSLLATVSLTTLAWNDTTAAGGASYEYLLASYSDSAESAPATAAINVPTDRLAGAAALVHGYPNPARDQVTFRISIDPAAPVAPTKVTIFDLTGHRICQLADRVLGPGENALSWRCRSDEGAKVAPGIYNVIVDGPGGRRVTRVAIVP